MTAPPASPSLPAALRALLARLSPARRRALPGLMALMLLGALAELVTIGALLPFLGAVADPDHSAALDLVRAWLAPFGLASQSQLILALTALFALAALAATAIRLLLLWSSQKFVYGVSCELSVALYANMLYQPYSFHIRHNSSETLAAIQKVQVVTGGVLMPLVQAVIATVIAGFIVAGLVLIDPAVALLSGLGFGLIYLGVTKLTRARLTRNSATLARAETERVKIVREGLGGIRDVLLDHSQPVFIEAFEAVEARSRDARNRNSFYVSAPRYVVESLGMILIALVAVMLNTRSGGLMGAIPVLGALAVGAQRLLPMIQQIYGGWASIMANRQSLADLVGLLSRTAVERASHPEGPLRFRRSIAFEDVSFTYRSDRKHALAGVDFTIRRGARVGLVGKTGSGKSTLTDLLIGLLEPTSGRILIDSVPLTPANRAAWQLQIAHVPQFIYLADATVAENIAFGFRRAKIDMTRVRRAAAQAELTEVIGGLPKGFDTLIGERGVQLSGGQRQRLGIARALYREATVLVFDEATSALDTETEAAVMQAIGGLSADLTVIIVAHRLSTVSDCEITIRLDAGEVAELASPAKRTPKFEIAG